jgi:hypothetical protein
LFGDEEQSLPDTAFEEITAATSVAQLDTGRSRHRQFLTNGPFWGYFRESRYSQPVTSGGRAAPSVSISQTSK